MNEMEKRLARRFKLHDGFVRKRQTNTYPEMQGSHRTSPRLLTSLQSIRSLSYERLAPTEPFTLAFSLYRTTIDSRSLDSRWRENLKIILSRHFENLPATIPIHHHHDHKLWYVVLLRHCLLTWSSYRAVVAMKFALLS